jgi:hypothetical protein
MEGNRCSKFFFFVVTQEILKAILHVDINVYHHRKKFQKVMLINPIGSNKANKQIVKTRPNFVFFMPHYFQLLYANVLVY